MRPAFRALFAAALLAPATVAFASSDRVLPEAQDTSPECLPPGRGPQEPDPVQKDCGIPVKALLSECGPFGIGCPAPIEIGFPEPPEGEPAPCIKGFADLGPKGTTGSIDGPNKKASGTYEVLELECHMAAFKVKTGYMDLELALVRDPKTGQDEIVIKGKAEDEEIEGRNAVALKYDEDDDEGEIAWKQKNKDGEEEDKEEGFWKGEKPRDSKMTIEFGGGYNHDFAHK